MGLLEIVRTYKIPYSYLAEKMGMNVNTFKVKMNTENRHFTDPELGKLRSAVNSYCLEIQRALPAAA